MLNPKQDWPANLTNTMAFIGVAAIVVIVAPWVGPMIKAASAIRQQQKGAQPQPQQPLPPPSQQVQPPPESLAR